MRKPLFNAWNFRLTFNDPSVAPAYASSCIPQADATVAQELLHSGLLRHDETLDRGGEEIAALELPGRPNAPVTARSAAARLREPVGL